jgi:cysteinyl-tRNA synthetase
MADIRDSVLDCVGGTPLVRLRRLGPRPGAELLAKLEGFNPCGSVKERIVAAMIEEAERDGRLRSGMTLVESSSGNTGIGLAMAAAVKGYPCLVVMSRKVSEERRRYVRAFGADLVLVDGGSDAAWDEADRLAASDPRKYCRLHQYRSAANVDVHARTTGPELWEQSGGRIDVLVATLGTTGTIVGCSRFLRSKNPRIRIVSVEPPPANEQQGLRNLSAQRVPEIWDPSCVDERRIVEDADAFRCARELATKEGIFAGISSGSAVSAAVEEARRLGSGIVVAILPDSGAKYLSTKCFDGPESG